MVYTIDGRTFPKAPSTCEHTVAQVVTNAQRTVGPGASATKELLAEKEKINCTWLYMTTREYAQLRQMGAGKNFFKLNYYDATTMTKKTKEFYGSDITATELNGLDRNDVPQGYQNIKWSFIER